MLRKRGPATQTQPFPCVPSAVTQGLWQTTLLPRQKACEGVPVPSGAAGARGWTRQPAVQIGCPQMTAAPALSFQPYKVKLYGGF